VLKSSHHHDISIAQGTASLLGSKINIFLYVIDGLVIDTGPSRIARDSRAFFNQLVIEQVALTHVHEDHSGMAAWLQSTQNVPVYLHNNSLAYAQQIGSYPLYRQIMWGKRPPFQPQAIPEHIYTNKYSFQVIDAPGHTTAHTIFYEKNQGWLFPGDLYLGTRQWVAFYEEDLTQTIDSIKKILALDFDTLFCAHSGVELEGKKKLAQKLDFLMALQKQVDDMRCQGFNNQQIDTKLFPKKQPITYLSRGEWSSYNMIRTL